jgi:hypothetical protein
LTLDERNGGGCTASRWMCIGLTIYTLAHDDR